MAEPSSLRKSKRRATSPYPSPQVVVVRDAGNRHKIILNLPSFIVIAILTQLIKG